MEHHGITHSVEDDSNAQHIAHEFALPMPIAQLLVARGYRDSATVAQFLVLDFNAQWSHPYHMPGVLSAAQAIWDAIRAQKMIVVYGDYDVDGVTATATLVEAIRRFGGTVAPFLPRRERDGYGLTASGVQHCLASLVQKPSLLITVDCGIGACEVVEQLMSQSIDVIITDHHTPGACLPKACVIVNPQLPGTPDAARHLCGAGVALKLVHAMVQWGRENAVYAGPSFAHELLVRVGLATVADVVPLVGENRLLAGLSMRLFQKHSGVGLRALLLKACKHQQDVPDTFTYGFLLGPRLNAAGRLTCAELAYNLLMTQSLDDATLLATQLDQLNAERRTQEKTLAEAAWMQCVGAHAPQEREHLSQQRAALVVGGPMKDGWHPGLIGIVAARLCDVARIPVAVIAFDAHGLGRGSVRAAEGYHVVEALTQVSELLDGFGGHACAGGFTLKPGMFAAFKEQFERICGQQRQQVPVSPYRMDGWLQAEDITLKFYQDEQRLAPFGVGHPKPCWGLRNVMLDDVRTMGADGAHVHLRWVLPTGQTVRGVWFHAAAKVESLRRSRHFDIVFELSENVYNNRRSLELMMVDAIPV